MLSDELKENWTRVEKYLAEKFGAGESPDLDAVLFLIGVQELGMGPRKFKKDEKVNLMHIAICRLLEPYGYYQFEGLDPQGWPHYSSKEKLPFLKPGEQSILMKEAVVRYFTEEELL